MHKSHFFRIASAFPVLSCFRGWSNFGRSERAVIEQLSNVIKTRMKERTQGEIRGKKDFLDYLLDESDKREANNEIPFHHDTLVSNLWGLFIGGFETSSTALAFMTHHLARLQMVQSTLFDELEEEFGGEEEMDIERLMKLPFLNAIYCETLRATPPVLTGAGRTCTMFSCYYTF
ncbi:hypothetical protein PFISCL1PPCAC_9487 [Pristionchus fissidentatus]|uniref:Cytochrome P450 n=1 Tax=Pristionchus fissidentatus TaxID=1538716 RepID=A0AAV5VHU8_9BILA|nr:hypothetical protein PFISCL1PPCAC_9487 [Pristionchus fissidentatus]